MIFTIIIQIPVLHQALYCIADSTMTIVKKDTQEIDVKKHILQHEKFEFVANSWISQSLFWFF